MWRVTTDRTVPEPGAPRDGVVYDAFISYSHAADDLLAPRLQAGLQRFAKPWWKRRALRVFRDESSLSANPHLWFSITKALDASGWFVLLLSPDAAESTWVNQEIEYWLAHKDPSRVLPVVTGGEFGWEQGDIYGAAVPDALRGVFTEEPRWVDLRFARQEEQLDLQNPRFSAAVADVASAVRGVAKDELESEEVRQHRRTVRTAWAAAVTLLALVVVAAAAAVYADEQRNRANDLADREADARRLAEENAAEARAAAGAETQARTEAEARRAEAERERMAAERQTVLAQARELVLEAEKALELDPELSGHLAGAAVEAFRSAGDEVPAAAVSAVRAAIAADRVQLRFPGGAFVGLSPDGSLLATANGDGGVAVWDIASRAVVETYGRDDAVAIGAAFSPDGSLLAVAFQNAQPPVTVWNRSSGGSRDVGSTPFPFSTQALAFSPDGALVAFDTYMELGVEVWSVAEPELVFRADEYSEGPDFSPEGLLSYGYFPPFPPAGVEGESGVRIVDVASGEIVRSHVTDISPFFSVWSPDGARLAVADQITALVLDVESGAELARTDFDRVFRPRWLPSGDSFIVGGESVSRVVDAATGSEAFELRGQTGGTWSYEVIPGTSLVASASLSGPDTVIFDASPLGGLELGGWLAPVDTTWSAYFAQGGDRVVVGDQASFVSGDALGGEDLTVVAGGAREISSWFPNGNLDASLMTASDPDGRWALHHSANGEVVFQAPPDWSIRTANHDGTRVVISSIPDVEGCSTRIVSTLDGSTVADLDAGCPFGMAWFSPDGQLLSTHNRSFSHPYRTALWDAATGEQRATIDGDQYAGVMGGFTPDGMRFVLGGAGGTVFVFDLPQLLAGVPPDQALVREIPAHDAVILWMRLSPDGSMAVTGAFNEPLMLWNLETGRQLGEFGPPPEGRHKFAGDFHPTLPRLMVATPPNEVRVHTLDLVELIRIGESRLSRDMTEPECERYFRRPCTTE